MLQKLNQSLTEDIAPLLPAGVQFNDDDAIAAFSSVWQELIARIPGDPWKSSPEAIEAIRGPSIRLSCMAIAPKGAVASAATTPYAFPNSLSIVLPISVVRLR